METEIWPNLLHAAGRRKTPVVLANARLSERSARGYGRLEGLVRPALAALAGIAAQTAGDARRLAELGAGALAVCGNLKFDVRPAPAQLALGQSWRLALAGRPVWLAASTREGEESLIIDAWRRLNRPDALLVLVPRHPQRFAEVGAAVQAAGLACRLRSQALPDAATDVWLGDSMGEMAAYYAMADIAFIGGSLLPLGGQNLIEAAACACPVLVGPHTFNFLQATEDAIAAGAARRVASVDELAAVLGEMLDDGQALADMRQAATRFAEADQGAAERTLDFIARQVAQAGR